MSKQSFEEYVASEIQARFDSIGFDAGVTLYLQGIQIIAPKNLTPHNTPLDLSLQAACRLFGIDLPQTDMHTAPAKFCLRCKIENADSGDST